MDSSLEDLDNEEFQLPTIDNLPLLEDLLDENDFDDENENSKPEIEYGFQFINELNAGDETSLRIESFSLKSKSSRCSEGKGSSKKKKALNDSSHCKHILLLGISSQMNSASERVNAGIPTVMSVSPNFIAIGMSHGLVLVFDKTQSLKWSLCGETFGLSYGSVSALAFSRSDRLLAGFAKGQCIEFELSTGKMIRELNEAHPLDHAVLQIVFLDDSSLALLSDSGGSVFVIYLKRVLGRRGYDSKCIFSGSRGEVCTICPLSLINFPNHPLYDKNIFALATISKIIVLSIRSSTKVLFSHELRGKGESLPQISWEFQRHSSSSSSSSVNPVLTFGRDSSIFLYQLSVSSNKILFVFLSKIQLNYDIMSMRWMNSKVLGLIDSNEIFHLYDVRVSLEYETLDISEIQLVYSSSVFKGLATGRNVSSALALAGNQAVYNSTHGMNNQFLFLGRRSVHALLLRSWKDRLHNLTIKNRFIECFHLGLEYYEDQGKAIFGASFISDEKWKRVLKAKLLTILSTFLGKVMEAPLFPLEGNIKTLTEYFSKIVPPTVSLCIRLEAQNILFDTVWNTFYEDPFAKAIFLESLETYILNDILNRLPVFICKEFISHYERAKMLTALEACITHIDVSCLDIHQVMTISESHSLYDAKIHIYNNALHDYISPLEELFSHLSSSEINLGNKILVYISSCLAGRSYSFGSIAPETIPSVKYDVYSTLTALHGKQEVGVLYGNLRALLEFDTPGLLNVISIAFEEEEFQEGDFGKCQKQRLIDILHKIIVLEERNSLQVSQFLLFLTRQNMVPLPIDKALEVLSVLLSEDDENFKRERQNALLDYISFTNDYILESRDLLALCEKVGFYRICETLYDSKTEIEKILDCYFKDKYRTSLFFSFFEKEIESSSETERREKCENYFMKQFEELCCLETHKTCILLVNYFPNKLKESIFKLRDNLNYLQTLIETLELSQKINRIMTNEIFNELIEAFATKDPNSLLSLLQSSFNYDSEAAFIKVKTIGALNAQIYLAEKCGRSFEAFKLMMTEVERLKSNQDSSLPSFLVQVMEFISSKDFESKKEDLWLTLLESILHPEYKDLVIILIQNALPHVSISRLISRILNDSMFQYSSFLEIKDFLTEMNSLYVYESNLLSSSKALCESNIYEALLAFKSQVSKGISVKFPLCRLCTQFSSSSTHITFPCGHYFHETCLKDTGCSQIRFHECYTCKTRETHTRNFKKRENTLNRVTRFLLYKRDLKDTRRLCRTSIFESSAFDLQLLPKSK